MKCQQARSLLMASQSRATSTTNPTTRELDGHLESCAECATFAARRDTVATALGGSAQPFLPDPSFSARVLARRPDPVEQLGNAGLKLLPGVLVLLLATAWLGTTAPPSPLEVLFGAEDTTAWLLAASGAGP